MKRIYRGLYAEQDTESPHYYLHRGIEELKGRIFLDIGAAEGFSSLQFVDWVDRIYLFEYEDEWIEALTATFLPYQDKCEIVKNTYAIRIRNRRSPWTRFFQTRAAQIYL